MRRQALASKASGGAVLLFASNEAEGPNDLYGYRPDDNFFYLSGWSEPGAALLIIRHAPTGQHTRALSDHAYTEILFLPNHNPSQEKWTGPKLGADSPDAGKITGFDHVEVLDNLRSELVRLLPAEAAQHLYRRGRRGRNLEFNRASGLAEARQCISCRGVFPGCPADAGFAPNLQRCGRNRAHPSRDRRLDCRAFRRHAYSEAGHHGARNLRADAI